MYFGNKDDNGGSGIAFNLFKSSNYGYRYNYDQFAMQRYPAVSIEFDTKDNGSYDPDNDHSSLHINGNNLSGTSTLGVTQSTNYSWSRHYMYPIQTVDLGNIEDGNWHEFTFNWNAAQKKLSVCLLYTSDAADE